ncbi:MAG: SDR family oxidoreductase [Acidimicrobiales bacterium]|nr:SDR family oxidoreductase [Acidimicrobiales bacterium]
MSEARDLSGTSAVVTGASSGIGRAIAVRLGAEGMHVVVGGRSADGLAETAQAVRAAGGQATEVAGDVREPSHVEALVAAAVDAGELTVMVNNAGVAWLGSVLDGDAEQWAAMLDTNVLALLVGSKAAIEAMRAAGTAGRIVNISSGAASRRDSGVYGATKHAVNVITSTLRLELQGEPIQVTSIMPGLVATNIGRNVDPEVLRGMLAMAGLEREVEAGAILSADDLDAIAAALSQIMITAEEVADAVGYVVTRPAHVNIPELAIRPNQDVDL